MKRNDIDYLEIDDPKELYKYPWAMINKTEVAANYMMASVTFYKFIEEVERLYNKRNNPYHNFKHALTVMNVCYSLFKMTSIRSYFMNTGVAAVMFSTLMHDIDHTGKNNLFEINSSSELAITYNDDSVLESHHSATAFEIISKKDMNIFVRMPISEYSIFRRLVIHAILSTDIKKHFVDVKLFKQRNDDQDFEPYEDGDNIEDFLLLLAIMVHSADLYVPTLPLERSAKWSTLVNQEFMEQSNFEVENNLPITPFYQGLEDPIKRAKSEKFFVSAIVSPLWSEVNRFLKGEISYLINNVATAEKHWEDEAEKLIAEKQQITSK